VELVLESFSADRTRIALVDRRVAHSERR